MLYVHAAHKTLMVDKNVLNSNENEKSREQNGNRK